MGSSIKVIVMGIMMVCGSGLALRLKAQTYNELFRQKKTQEKYLLKQLAYLRLYADQAWKGYKLVSGGLETINNFTAGEFKFHEAFISGLSTASGLVKKDVRVEEVMQFQVVINAVFRSLQKSALLAQDPNLAYYKAVQKTVVDECDGLLDDLAVVLSSNGLEMGDAERLSRLEQIHASMRDKADFVRWFCTQAKLLARARTREKVDIQELRRLYEKN